MKGPPAVIISLCSCLWTCAAPAQEPGGPGSTLLLTNIAQVRALSTEQAKRKVAKRSNSRQRSRRFST
jgi:hypothetical protein